MSHIVSLLYLSLGKIKPVANEGEPKKKTRGENSSIYSNCFSNSVQGIVVSSTCYMH